MNHPLYRVCAVEIVEPYTLRVQFTDNTEQIINFNRFLPAKMQIQALRPKMMMLARWAAESILAAFCRRS